MQVTGDLDYLDYGARMYDGGLGRWFSVDPAAEEYTGISPYNYCLGNPVNLSDPTGMWVEHPKGGLWTNDPGEINNFWTAMQYEWDTRDSWSGFGDWAWNFAMNETLGNPMYQSDGTLFGYSLSDVQVVGSWNRHYVTLASMERWCNEYGATIGCGDYFNQVEASGYFYSKKSLLSPEDQQILFNRGVIGRKDFLEHPVTQLVGGVMTSFIPMGAFGNFGKLFVNGGKGLSNLQLVTKAGEKAFKNIAGKGNVVGIARHEYATTLLKRYQSIYGNRGLQFKIRSADSKAILDVLDSKNNIIYDWKFGSTAKMSQKQYLKYRYYFPNAKIVPLLYR